MKDSVKIVKTLYNFYFDEEDKRLVTEKVERLCGKQNKGQVSALIRVLLKKFIATPDERVNPLLIEAIEAEYVLSTKCNKRSRM